MSVHLVIITVLTFICNCAKSAFVCTSQHVQASCWWASRHGGQRQCITQSGELRGNNPLRKFKWDQSLKPTAFLVILPACKTGATALNSLSISKFAPAQSAAVQDGGHRELVRALFREILWRHHAIRWGFVLRRFMTQEINGDWALKVSRANTTYFKEKLDPVVAFSWRPSA